MRKGLIVVSTLLLSHLLITDIKMQSRHLALIILSLSAIITVAHSIKCGPNERLVECPSNCGNICGATNGTFGCPIITCNTPGCVCDPGFVRETSAENSPCIPESQCPTSTTSY